MPRLSPSFSNAEQMNFISFTVSIVKPPLPGSWHHWLSFLQHVLSCICYSLNAAASSAFSVDSIDKAHLSQPPHINPLPKLFIALDCSPFNGFQPLSICQGSLDLVAVHQEILKPHRLELSGLPGTSWTSVSLTPEMRRCQSVVQRGKRAYGKPWGKEEGHQVVAEKEDRGKAGLRPSLNMGLKAVRQLYGMPNRQKACPRHEDEWNWDTKKSQRPIGTHCPALHWPKGKPLATRGHGPVELEMYCQIYPQVWSLKVKKSIWNIT